MTDALLAARLGYKFSSRNGKITRWADARPQPNWNALREKVKAIAKAEDEAEKALQLVARKKLEESPEGIAILAARDAKLEALK